MKKIIVSSLLVLMMQQLTAQIKPLDNDSLQKQNFAPSEVQMEIKRENFIYNMPMQDLLLEYKALPAKPLSFKAKPSGEYNWLKLGYGSLQNKIAEASTQIHINKKVLHLLGAYNAASASILQNHSHLLFGASLFTPNNNNYKAQYGMQIVNQNQNKYGYFYSVDSIDEPNYLTKIRFTAVQANAKWNKENQNKNYWQPEIAAHIVNTNTTLQEANLNATLAYHFINKKEGNWIVELNTQVAQIKNASGNTNYSFVQPNIGYKVQNENRELAIGTIALLTNANQYLLPYFTFQKKAGEGELIFSAGIKCESLQTNLKNLLAINPFADYANRNLQIGVLQKAYLGFSKDINNTMIVHAQVNYINYQNAIRFNSQFDSMKHNSIVFDFINTNGVSLQTGLQYRATKKILLGTDFDFQYFLGADIYQIPKMQNTSYFVKNFSKKLSWKTNLLWMSGLSSNNENNTLKSIAAIRDVNTKVEYIFGKWVGAYAQWNNILNAKNMHWYGYQSYQSNIAVGVQLRNYSILNR
ncbi:MAG: hypothetical protein ORN55_09360 [Chitinophagaceae bacterium]|nr:hypothetical protein [Chitinophagaceae bacterium]